MAAKTRSFLRSGFAVAFVVGVYAILVLPTLNHLGIGWDEQTDLGIARTYSEGAGGWLIGSDVDPVNVRLPMAASAVWFEIFTPELEAARVLACILGAFTLIAVMTFCRRELDARKAFAAGLLLATSPYFLAYSKSAFSDGDAFITCAVAMLLVGLAYLRKERNLGWGAATAVALGAALACKISAVATIPAIAVVLLLPASDEPVPQESLSRRTWTVLVTLLVLLYVSVFGGWEIGKRLTTGPYEEAGLAFLALHASLVVALWLAVLTVAWLHRGERLQRGRLTAFVLVLGGMTFFVLPPLHTTNPDIFNSLIGAFLFSNVKQPAMFALEAAALHFAVIAIKPSLLIGLAAWLSVCVAAARLRARPELRLPLLFVVCYLLFLLSLPWAQTYYMLPAFPPLAILLADMGVEFFDRRRTAAVTLAVAASLLLGIDLARSYPDYHLNGYQWVGANLWGGRPTIGSRSLVQMPTDGAEQALRWIDARAEPSDTVVTFVRPWHIIAATIPKPHYTLVNGRDDPGAITRADYVVTTLAAEIRHGHRMDNPTEVWAVPYDREQLERDFTRVHSLMRAFDLEVATVWQRKRSEPER
jgi:asparagine N-glycosylation enzyme membrane subunit Stt3